MPFVGYGLTDGISLAGGTLIYPRAFGRVFYVAPKVTVYQGSDLAVALGGVDLRAFFEEFRTTAGIGYGLVTYGTPERALTLGLGFSFAEGEISSGAIVTLGGELQLSNSIKLLSENYLLPIRRYESIWEPDARTTYEPIFSFGVRFFGQRLAVDLAGSTSPELIGEDIFPFFPWVGFAYHLGR